LRHKIADNSIAVPPGYGKQASLIKHVRGVEQH